jgi:hypothetical protein
MTEYDSDRMRQQIKQIIQEEAEATAAVAVYGKRFARWCKTKPWGLAKHLLRLP